MTRDIGMMKTRSGKYMTDQQDIFLCKDCKHCKATFWARINKDPDGHFCELLSQDRIDLVTGKIIRSTPVTCKEARVERYSAANKIACGPDGKNWKPKNKNDLFRLIVKASNE
jgi:hypothetical protein